MFCAISDLASAVDSTIAVTMRSRGGDLVGRRFGKLTVIIRSGSDAKNSTWLCRCDCGGTKVTRRSRLLGGTTRSCGCLLRPPHPTGENHPRWKGDNVSYPSLHQWLAKSFPKAGICEECGLRTSRTEYSKLEGRDYTRKRDDYRELCVRCHRFADKNPIALGTSRG